MNGLNGHLFIGESVFLVQNVSLHDEGEYICEGFNEHGRIGWGALLVVEKGDFLFFISFYYNYDLEQIAIL